MNINSIIISVVGSIIFASITAICKWIVETYKNRKWCDREVNRILFDLLSEEEEGKLNILDIIKSKFYIPIRVIKPMGDNQIGPHDNNTVEAEELETIPFIDYLINSVFSKKSKPGKKRFLVLGGSGMGKSTFSAAFVYFYIKKYNKKSIPFDIKLIILGQNLDIDKNSIENPQRTILILDGLDENLEAIRSKKDFVNKIEDKFHDVGGIILTCRTQFLEDKNEEVINIKVPTITKYLNYKVFYISPFTKEDIRNYLGNKYQIPSDSYSKALRIADRSADIMSRPLILSFIDDILDLAYNNNLSTFLIYKKIIDSWFDRECKTFNIYEKTEKDNIIGKLYSYSKKIAVFIYNEWEKTGELSISKDKFEEFIEMIGCNEGIPFSFKDRSLLNRKSDGSIKFSHKSFLEFFLAIDAVENPGTPYSPLGFEMASTFLKEIYQLQLKGVTFPCINYYSSANIEYNYDNLRSILYDTSNKIENTQDEKQKESVFYTGLYEYFDKFIQSVKMFLIFHPNVTDILWNELEYIYELFDDGIELFKKYNKKNEGDPYKPALSFLEYLFGSPTLFKSANEVFQIPISTNITTTNLISDDEYEFIEINSCFVSDDDISNYISRLSQRNQNIKLFTIIKNGKSVREILNFISFLRSKMDNLYKIEIFVYGKVGPNNNHYVININHLGNRNPERIIERMIKYQSNCVNENI